MPLSSKRIRPFRVKFLRRAVNLLISIGERPERTALAYSLGVFVGFSPLLGLHTVLGLLLALVFRLNKAVVLVGVYTNNPWLVVPFYGFATWLGMKVLGSHEGISPPDVGLLELFTAEFWQWLTSQGGLLIPAIVGSTILCTVFACVAYPVALYAIRRN